MYFGTCIPDSYFNELAILQNCFSKPKRGCVSLAITNLIGQTNKSSLSQTSQWNWIITLNWQWSRSPNNRKFPLSSLQWSFLHLEVSRWSTQIACCAAASFTAAVGLWNCFPPLLESNFHALRELGARVAAGGAPRYLRLVTEAASRPARLTAATLSGGSCWSYKHWCSVSLSASDVLIKEERKKNLLVSRNNRSFLLL